MDQRTFEGVEWIFLPVGAGIHRSFAEDDSLDFDEIVIQLNGRAGLFSLKPEDGGKGIRVQLNVQGRIAAILSRMGDVQQFHVDTSRVHFEIQLDISGEWILMRYPPGKKPQPPQEQ